MIDAATGAPYRTDHVGRSSIEPGAGAPGRHALRPEHPESHVVAAASYGLVGDDKKAVDALAGLRALVAEVTASNVEKTWPYVLAEDRARLAQGLRKAGLPE